jgi:hypothetical protein
LQHLKGDLKTLVKKTSLKQLKLAQHLMANKKRLKEKTFCDPKTFLGSKLGS